MDELNEDFVSPEVLQQYATNTFSKTYTNSKNPFQLPPESEIFGFKEFEKKRVQNERESIRRMSLIQRADLQKPKIPTCVLSSSLISRKSAAKSFSSLSSSSSSKILNQRLDSNKQRSIRVNEFVQQTREIYIIQLLINKKAEEIKKIHNLMESSEKELIKRNESIEADLEKIKLANTQTEMKLARAKRRMETAITKKVELQKDLKNVSNNLFTMNSEISKNEGQLESFISYQDFLERMTPDGKDIFEHFNNPQILLDEIFQVEQENLNLIKSCQYYDTVLEKSVSVIKKQSDETIDLTQTVRGQLEKIPQIEEPPDLFPACQKLFDTRESEVHSLSWLVEQTYVKCFGVTADVTPVVMLQRINRKLEEFYKKMELLDTEFLQSRLAVKDKQRREKQRKQKQEKQKEELKVKMDQAIERANRPIKKKCGRPVYARCVPRKSEKKEDLKLLRELNEKKQTEKLLFGEAFEEY